MISAISIIQPKQPNGTGWVEQDASFLKSSYPLKAWAHESGLFCLSAVEVANEPGQPELGAEYHLSISMNGQRCSSAEAAFALYAFDLGDAKEDNHVPSGKVRNYWRPVADNLSGYECKCVDEEPAIKEDKGDYVWRGVS
ncbi:MAG TPA: hypothetical protein VES38_06615 [Methylotenera sp.]|nr:hypothetical protein [Methylotenera sp.]